MPALPDSARHLVIGAGVHGLSTAWHLADAGEEALVVDKAGVAAGASGIACGVIRNNYFQPAMQELMAACVEIWESDPEGLSYHGSGYVALGPPAQEDELSEVFERQQRIGYPSELYTGEDEVAAHMRGLFGDWRAEGLTVCLHERAGGFAFNRESMLGLADKARAAGATIVEGVEVTGFSLDGSGAVERVETTAGDVYVDQVVVAVGPWIASLWEMLGQPDRIDVRRPDGSVDRDLPMWTYWYLQEGEVALPPSTLSTDDGRESPVLHVDSHRPLIADDGELVTDQPWGIYVKPDRRTVQGGAQPLTVGEASRWTPIRPAAWSRGSPISGARRSPTAWSGSRAAAPATYRSAPGEPEPSAPTTSPSSIGCCPNVYVAADSNHGYKMIAVGREIARVLQGEHSSLLHPFRFERFETGDLHPVSSSPYPWS